MTSITQDHRAHEVAVVRTLQAMLEEALHRSDLAVARDLAEQIEHEIRRQSAHSRRA